MFTRGSGGSGHVPLRDFLLFLCFRRGRSAIFSNADAFESLLTPCLGTAVPTCLERPYTWHFARQYLHCVRIGPGPLPSVDNSARAATLSQPKASKFPSLVSEHQQVVLAYGQCDWPVGVMQRHKAPMPLPPRVQCALRTLHEGSQLLRITSRASAESGGKVLGAKVQDSSASEGSSNVFASTVEAAWGIPRAPEEFVKAAVAAGHPCRNEFSLPSALKKAIQTNASQHTAITATNPRRGPGEVAG